VGFGRWCWCAGEQFLLPPCRALLAGRESFRTQSKHSRACFHLPSHAALAREPDSFLYASVSSNCVASRPVCVASRSVQVACPGHWSFLRPGRSSAAEACAEGGGGARRARGQASRSCAGCSGASAAAGAAAAAGCAPASGGAGGESPTSATASGLAAGDHPAAASSAAASAEAPEAVFRAVRTRCLRAGARAGGTADAAGA
jgi:hypothetical protein